MITPMALATYSLIVLFIFGLAALVLIISRPTQEERERNGEQQVSSTKEGFLYVGALLLFFTILTIMARKARHT